MRRLAAIFALAIFLLLPTSVAAAECQFVLGFKTIRDLIGHDIVGECLENQHHGANGDGLQQTTGGLMVWRKADNWTAFTDGYRSWVNGPNGLEQRLNTERFDWEVENILAALPLHPTDASPIENLRELARVATPAFLAIVEAAGDDPVSSINAWHTVNIAKVDSTLALQLVQMPFLRSRYQGSDHTALDFASDLARSDPAALRRVLSHPQLTGGVTDDLVAVFVMLVLAETRPAAAAALQDLPWVQDGVSRPFFNNRINVGVPLIREEETVISLARMAVNSEEAALIVLGKPWIQDRLENWDFQVVSRLSQISDNAPAIALQIAGMPFLDTISATDIGIVGPLFELLLVNEGGLVELLALPELRGGITDGHYILVRELVESYKSR